MSLAVVFECGHVARVFVMFDDDAHREGRTADVSALFARVRLANEIPYLVTVDDVLGFLEASARPVPVGCVVFYPATVGGVGDVCEGFVKSDGHGRCPFLRKNVRCRALVIGWFYCTTVSVLFACGGVWCARRSPGPVVSLGPGLLLVRVLDLEGCVDNEGCVPCWCGRVLRSVCVLWGVVACGCFFWFGRWRVVCLVLLFLWLFPGG